MAASTSREPPKKHAKSAARKGKGKLNVSKPSQAISGSSRRNEREGSDWEWCPLTEPSTSRFTPIFSRDGSFFFSLAGSTVKIHSTATGRTVSTLTVPRPPHKNSSLNILTSAVLNPHNPLQLITGSLDGRLIIWDFLDAVILRTIDIAQPIHYICAHEQWRNTVFVAASKDNSMDKNGVVFRVSFKPVNRSTKSLEILPIGKTAFPAGLALSSCGTWLVAAAGHRVYIVETSSLASGFTKYVSPDQLTCLAFHPNEQYFATGDDKGKIRIWYCLNDDLAVNVRGLEKKTPTVALHWHAHAVWAIAFTSNGAYLLTGGEESVLVVWQLHTGKKEFVPRVGAPISSVSVFSGENGGEQYLLGLADATYLVVSSGNLKVSKSYSGIKLDPRAYYVSPIDKIPTPLAMHMLTSTLILPSSHPSSLQIFSPSTSTLVSEIEVSPSNRVSRRDERPIVHSLVQEAAVSPSGEWLATVDTREIVDGFAGDTHLKLWSWDSNASRWSLNTRIHRPHGRRKVTSLAFSPTSHNFSTHLVTTGEDGAVKIWGVRVVKNKSKIESWVPRTIFELRFEIPRSATWSPDASLLVVVFEPYIALYDPTTNLLRRTLTSPGVKAVKAAQFIGNAGRFLVVAGDHDLILWDLVSHAVLWNYRSPWVIERVVPHTSNDTFSVFQDTSTQDSRKTQVLVFHTKSPVPSKTHLVPLKFRNLLSYSWPHKALGRNFVAITDDWRVVVFGDDAKPTKEGSSANALVPAPSSSNHSLFQDIFGKSAFTQYQTLPMPVDLQRLHTSKASRDMLDAPAYLALPLEHRFDSLLAGFLKRRQDSPTLPPAQEDDIHVDKTPEAFLLSTRQGRVVSQGEIDIFIRLFREHSIESPSVNGRVNQAEQRAHQFSDISTSEHALMRTATSGFVEDSLRTPSIVPLVNSRKRKQAVA